jgi:hypothetical protein
MVSYELGTWWAENYKDESNQLPYGPFGYNLMKLWISEVINSFRLVLLIMTLLKLWDISSSLVLSRDSVHAREHTP